MVGDAPDIIFGLPLAPQAKGPQVPTGRRGPLKWMASAQGFWAQGRLRADRFPVPVAPASQRLLNCHHGRAHRPFRRVAGPAGPSARWPGTPASANPFLTFMNRMPALPPPSPSLVTLSSKSHTVLALGTACACPRHDRASRPPQDHSLHAGPIPGICGRPCFAPASPAP